MSTDRQVPAADAKAKGVAGEAALFVTFYSAREKATPLYERLKFLIQQEPTNKLSPLRYDLPAAQDATAIWFAINAPDEDAATAWENTRQELNSILADKDLPKDWWGYTLVYQAVLNRGVELASVPDKLLSTVRRLDSPKSLEPLEQADIAGGRVWLMGIPRGDGLATATVYVALSASKEETAFQQALFGTQLSMLDLIAHKGYKLRREYCSDLERDYEKVLNAFRESTYDLLSDLGRQTEETPNLGDLPNKYEMLVKFVSELKRLRISVAQQLPNYRKWQDQMGSNGITEFHYGHLDMTHRELELIVDEGQDALETANIALSMAQVQIDKAQVQAEKENERKQLERDKAQDRRQRRIEIWLAAVALALALAHVLEPDTTRALLGSWPISLHLPDTASGLRIVLGARVAIILIFALVVVWIARFLESRSESAEQDLKDPIIESESAQNGDSKQPSRSEEHTNSNSSDPLRK